MEDENRRKAFEMYQKGAGYDDIALRFNTTRGSVAGMISRLKISQNFHIPKNGKKWGNTLNHFKRKTKIFEYKGLVDLIDLRDHHCRYPISGKYCGKPVTRKSYCHEHALKCYTNKWRESENELDTQ